MTCSHNTEPPDRLVKTDQCGPANKLIQAKPSGILPYNTKQADSLTRYWIGQIKPTRHSLGFFYCQHTINSQKTPTMTHLLDIHEVKPTLTYSHNTNQDTNW